MVAFLACVVLLSNAVAEPLRDEIDIWIGIPVIILAISFFVFQMVAGRSRLSSLPRSVEDRLDELERLNRREMVTPEEYAAKRQEILNDL
jgi:hypothetical protein